MPVTSKAICILGSGRCGTSSITRAVNLLGVHIGSNLIPSNKANPKGFWEDKKIVSIHMQILKEFGGTTRLFPANWWKSKKVEPYKEKIVGYLKENFLDKEIWGWKDPRTCHTLELWKEILRELDVSSHYLIMIRNPIDVVHSYKKAFNYSPDKSLAQWKLRTLLALSRTHGESRMIIDYDQLMDNPLGTLRKVSTAFHIPWPQNEKQLKNKLNHFIDHNLQHSRTGLKKLMESNDYEDEIKETYRLCYKASQSPAFSESDELKSKVDGLL